MGLAQNCQKFQLDGVGKVIGIELGITKIANAKYEVYSVELIDEYNSGGNTVAYCSVLDKNNIPNGEQVRLTWAGKQPPFADSGLAGNGRNEHFISNKFNPPSQGPLALHTGGFNAPTSDIVYGLGLPFGHHVSFRVVFREKGATNPTDPTTPPSTDLDSINARLDALEATVAQHSQRLAKLESTGGAGGYTLPSHRMGVHWIPVSTNYQNHKDYIRALKPGVIKVVNGNRGDLEHCLANLDPGGVLVVRDHARSEQQDFLARDPVGCGKQHALEWKKDFSVGGKYYGIPTDKIVVCGLNEPFVRSKDEEKKVLDYTIAFLNDLKTYGLRGLCLNLSVGWVGNNGSNTLPVWDTFMPLEKIINDGNHVLGLHEYWYGDPDDSWTTIDGIKFGWTGHRHHAVPLQVPIIIGECGLTKNIDIIRWQNDGRPPKGWIGNVTPDAYAEQLWRYARKCTPNVIGVLPFTTGYASQDWAEDDTTAAHSSIVRRKEEYHFPDNFPVVPDAAKVVTTNPLSDPNLLIYPKFAGIVSGYYGQVYTNSVGGKYSHEGLDIATPTGIPIYAAYDGVVGYSGIDSLYGEYVRTYHKELNVCFFYAHLSRRTVHNGETVKQGQIIGYSGNSGNSSGPHIHFEARAMNSNSSSYKLGISPHGNARIDPIAFSVGWQAAGKRVIER